MWDVIRWGVGIIAFIARWVQWLFESTPVNQLNGIEYLEKARITRELKSLDAVGLETVALPDRIDRRLTVRPRRTPSSQTRPT
jgi:hypothetical protein